MLFLKAICSEMGIKGEIDDQGNVYNPIITEEKTEEKLILGFIKVSKVIKEKTERGATVMTLQEVMARRLGIEYDPNVIVKAALTSVLGDS